MMSAADTRIYLTSAKIKFWHVTDRLSVFPTVGFCKERSLLARLYHMEIMDQ